MLAFESDGALLSLWHSFAGPTLCTDVASRVVVPCCRCVLIAMVGLECNAALSVVVLGALWHSFAGPAFCTGLVCVGCHHRGLRGGWGAEMVVAPV